MLCVLSNESSSFILGSNGPHGRQRANNNNYYGDKSKDQTVEGSLEEQARICIYTKNIEIKALMGILVFQF